MFPWKPGTTADGRESHVACKVMQVPVAICDTLSHFITQRLAQTLEKLDLKMVLIVDKDDLKYVWEDTGVVYVVMDGHSRIL